MAEGCGLGGRVGDGFGRGEEVVAGGGVDDPGGRVAFEARAMSVSR